MTSINIRVGIEADIPEVLQLVKDLALFEKAPHEVKVSEAEMLRYGFGSEKVFDFFVAIDTTQNNKIVGIAIYYFKYSTWKGKCLYLEDIFVLEKYRSNGIGQMLFESVVNVYKKLGLRKMEWQVLNWNKRAIQFYEKNKASFDEQWMNGKLENLS